MGDGEGLRTGAMARREKAENYVEGEKRWVKEWTE